MHEACGCALTQRQTFHLNVATRPRVPAINSDSVSACLKVRKVNFSSSSATCCVTYCLSVSELLSHPGPKVSDLQNTEFGFHKGSLEHEMWAKSSPLSAFVNKVLLRHNHACEFTIVCSHEGRVEQL